jgi:hypothetical protein
MTVKIIIGHNANSREVFEALKERLEAYADAYESYKGFAGDEDAARKYLTLGLEMEGLLVELFDAKVGRWGQGEEQTDYEIEQANLLNELENNK